MDSILNSIKKMLGISPEYSQFDNDIIMCINSAMVSLSQIGFSNADNYSIVDSSNSWNELLNGVGNSEIVKTYIWLKVRMMFDPPTSSVVVDAIKNNISEMEFRINNLSGGF